MIAGLSVYAWFMLSVLLLVVLLAGEAVREVRAERRGRGR